MKRIKLFLALSVLAILLCGISSCSKEESDKPNTEQPDPEPTPEPTPEPAPEPDDYKLQGNMQAAQQLVGKDYSEIHK